MAFLLALWSSTLLLLVGGIGGAALMYREYVEVRNGE